MYTNINWEIYLILSTVISSGADISEVPGCHLLMTNEFSVRVKKITSRIGVSHELTA